MPSRIRQDSKRHKSSQRRGGLIPLRVPSASTLFRFTIMDVETRDLMVKGTSRFKPLLRMTSGADKMWPYYQKVVRNRGGSYFVGALWGLIDLGDERAGEALVELLRKGRYFYELFGFLALAGDARAVIPLARATEQAVEAERMDPMMALLSVGHRIGREALLAEFNKITSPNGPPGSAEAAGDAILSKPASYPEDHFQLFYRRLTASDLDNIF